MKRKSTEPPCPLHAIWRTVRGPFRVMECKEQSHKWERYDCNYAGCLLCGTQHRCETNLVDSKCPLAELDDGAICCTVTGFCVPNVRYGKGEYVDSAMPPPNPAARRGVELHDEIHSTVEWFLGGEQAEDSRKDEVDRTLARYQQLLVRALKQHKMDEAAQGLNRMPVLPCVVASAMHGLRPRMCVPVTRALCLQCSERITKCLTDLGMTGAPGKRVDLVVGMLYLMKNGLTIANTQWLPRIPALKHCLPHESTLERRFKLSTKLICTCENEIKLHLRQRAGML